MTNPPSANGRATRECDTRILYCHCKYAEVIPAEVKSSVLAGLNSSRLGFDSVPDLCEMSARKDPALSRLAAAGDIKIVACYARAVQGLFHAAGSPLPEQGVEILNMREQSAAEILEKLLPSSTSAPTEREV